MSLTGIAIDTKQLLKGLCKFFFLLNLAVGFLAYLRAFYCYRQKLDEAKEMWLAVVAGTVVFGFISIIVHFVMEVCEEKAGQEHTDG